MLNKINLARIDLNLLVLFEAVLEERHVARAASRLHVSPSAVSHGLGRLRELMKDPLFLRQPRAVGFDPRKSVRRFMIGAPDAVTAILLPGLIRELQRQAPGIDLAARNIAGQFEPALAELDQRTLDVALLPMPQVPARFMTRTIFDVEDFVIVRRAGHPIGKKLTLAKYCAAAHVVVSPKGDPHGLVSRALAKRGLSRRVALTVSSFADALTIAAETDLLGAMPRRYIAMYGARYKVIACETPVPLASEPILAVAPQAAASDSGLVWLLDLLEKVARAS